MESREWKAKTWILFKDGKVVETSVGVQPKERYEQALQQVAA